MPELRIGDLYDLTFGTFNLPRQDFYSRSEHPIDRADRIIREGPASRIFPILALPENVRHSVEEEQEILEMLLLPGLVPPKSLAKLQANGISVRRIIERNFFLADQYLLTDLFYPSDKAVYVSDYFSEWEESLKGFLLKEVRIYNPFSGSKKEPPLFSTCQFSFTEYGFALTMKLIGEDDGVRFQEQSIMRYRKKSLRALFKMSRRKRVTIRVLENVSPYLELDELIEGVLLPKISEELFFL